MCPGHARKVTARHPILFFPEFFVVCSEYVSCKKIYVSFLVFQKRKDSPPFDLISNSPNVKRMNTEPTKRIVHCIPVTNKRNKKKTTEEFEKSVTKKFNYTLLFMKYYIYNNKLHTSSILLADFVKYKIECIEA